MSNKFSKLNACLAGGLLASAGQAYAGYLYTDLGTLGGDGSYAYGINNAGQVVGYSDTTGYSGRIQK